MTTLEAAEIVARWMQLHHSPRHPSRKSAERHLRYEIEQHAINQRWLRGEIDTATHDAGRWA